jgi:hypothetical protein
MYRFDISFLSLLARVIYCFRGLVFRFIHLWQTSCLLRKQVDLEDTPTHPVADLGVTHSPVSARESRIVGIAGSTRFNRHSTRVPEFHFGTCLVLFVIVLQRGRAGVNYERERASCRDLRAGQGSRGAISFTVSDLDGILRN